MYEERTDLGLIVWPLLASEVIEIQGEKLRKSEHPPYSPNAWAELANFLARDPSCE